MCLDPSSIRKNSRVYHCILRRVPTYKKKLSEILLIQAPWSESLSLNNEVNICPFVCPSICPPTNYHENSI